jgi:hypothetical protein
MLRVAGIAGGVPLNCHFNCPSYLLDRGILLDGVCAGPYRRIRQTLPH